MAYADADFLRHAPRPPVYTLGRLISSLAYRNQADGSKRRSTQQVSQRIAGPLKKGAAR